MEKSIGLYRILSLPTVFDHLGKKYYSKIGSFLFLNLDKRDITGLNSAVFVKRSKVIKSDIIKVDVIQTLSN